MKELVVISGKGGTGKTSITAALAVLSKKTVVADCDVDAADLHLLLTPSINKTTQFISGHEAAIDSDLCAFCGQCVEFCRFNAVKEFDDKYCIDSVNCEGCMVCVEMCPLGAIGFLESNCGEWYSSDTDYGPMIHAKLKAGAENSGRLVSLVRQEARKRAEENDLKLVLVDGPPGIGCPVISSITGADYVLIVTEPTISGFHDLERIYKVTKHFKINAMITVNKWDLNKRIYKEIQEFAKVEDIPLVGRIPYSPLFSEAQVQGQTVVQYKFDDPVSYEVRMLWRRILSLLVTSSNKKVEN